MTLKTVFLWFSSLIFLLFMGLQFNDLSQFGNGDAWLWIVIYIVAAVLNAPPVFSSLTSTVYASAMGFSLGALLFRLQDDQGNLQWERLDPANFYGPPDIVQQANESGGLLILSIWMVVLFILKSRSKT